MDLKPQFSHVATKNMVDFRGRNLSFAQGQSTQFCDKTDYKPPFWSADSLPLTTGGDGDKLQSRTISLFIDVLFGVLWWLNKATEL